MSVGTAKKPNVGNLRIFGQTAIVLLNNYSKFQKKGKKVILVGYTDIFNTYKFYDPAANRVITNCNVKFLDNNNFVQQSGENLEPQIMTISHEITNNDGPELPHRNPTTPKADTDTSTLYFSTPLTNIGRRTAQQQNETLNLTDTTIRPATPGEPLYDVLETIQSPSVPRETIMSQSINHAKLSTVETLDDPNNYREAMARPDKDLWLQAMDDELKSLHKNNVWTLVDKPNANIVSNRWVL